MEVTDVKKRTLDVKVQENVDFDSLLLSEEVLAGLKQCGFEKPSPIQLKAIPLGRCGLDLIVQAKSGTGKTCVFSVIALENIMLNSPGTQVLIITPTREIAVQIWEVINSLAAAMPKLRCYTFIGGLPISEDKVKLKKCHIAVGTPGRVRQLIEEQALNTESIRLFILDEADKLMEQGFQETVNWIYSSLPENKQMLAVSATYPEILAKHLTAYMRNPTFVRLNTNDLSLLGIRQYYTSVQFSPLQQKAFEIKCKVLMDLLNAISFQQCLVFSNYQLRAQSLSDVLNREGWPATYISGSQDQQDRLTAMSKLKSFKCRVLISTDLTSRGIDAENVNLIINMDIPRDHETYLHRIGRAGRYGTYGAAITLASLGKEMANLKEIEKKANTKIIPLPDPVPVDLAQASGFVDYSHHVTVHSVDGVEQNATKPAELGVETADGLNELPSVNSLADINDGPTTQEALIGQENDGLIVNEKKAARQQAMIGNSECSESNQDVRELIDTLESTVLSEYTKMEQLLTLTDVNGSGGTTESWSSKQCPKSEQQVVLEPGSEVIQSSAGLTNEDNENTKQPMAEDDSMAHDTRAASWLPKPELLEKFARSICCDHGDKPDFVLPVLGDLLIREKRVLPSYASIMADYEQFAKTGKSFLQSNQVSNSFDSNTFDSALQKVAALINRSDLFERVTLTENLDVQDDTSDQVCAAEDAAVKKHNDSNRRASDLLPSEAVASGVRYTQPAGDSNTLIGFSKLNSYFESSSMLSSSSSQGVKKIAHSKQRRTDTSQTLEKTGNHATNSRQMAEDRKLGLELMNRLRAQQDTDTSDSELSDSESDDSGSGGLYTSDGIVEADTGIDDQDPHCDRCYTDAWTEVPKDDGDRARGLRYAHVPTSERDHVSWDGASYHQRSHHWEPDYVWCYGDARPDLQKEPDPCEKTTGHTEGLSSVYGGPSELAHEQYYTGWDGGGYCQGQMNARHKPHNYMQMASFPYQLWMQCAGLLGSINATYAAQYSWYCQQWYSYHLKCAKFYVGQYKKHKARFQRCK